MEKVKKPRVKKEKPPKPPKEVLTEQQLAEKQGAKMARDMQRLMATQSKSVDQKEVREGVDIWKDSDFYFCVVFQSAAQKYSFLEFMSKKLGLGVDNAKSDNQILQIVNGLTFAEKMGCKLQPEKSGNYPYPNLELKELALDAEEF